MPLTISKSRFKASILADPVITGASQKSANVGDVASKPSALQNLGAMISVKAHGAVGDGVTSDQTAVAAAVAAAVAIGADLYWPAGTYLTTASITDFHTVRHRGPGIVKRGTQLFYVEPVAGQVNKIYVDPTGSDTNDGLSNATPLREIKAAAALLTNYNGSVGAEWQLLPNVAGAYKGGILVPSGFASRNWVKIIGVSATHPNASTTVISYAADTSATYGIFASDGTKLWLENIRIDGAFSQGVYVSRGVYLQWRNVHVTGGAVTGLQVNNQCRYFVTGGKISNCISYGILELFHVVRSFDTVATSADQLIIEFAGKTGLKAKENCVGHLDYLNIQDCPVGVEFQLYSGANCANLTLKRNQLALCIVNSQLHEYNNIAWGTGADLNTRRLKMRGRSNIPDMWSWAVDGGVASELGQALPIKIAQNFTLTTVTGTISETDVYNFVSLLKADIYAAKGAKIIAKAHGRIGASALTGTSRVLFRIGGTFMTDVTLPVGTPANAFWEAEWEVTCTADGANQMVRSKLFVEGTSSAGLVDITAFSRTADLSAADRGVIISIINSASGDSNSVWGAEIYG